MKPAIALWLLVAAGVAHAAPLIDEPVAELRLTTGKALRDAIAKAYNPNTILIRHADGGTAVPYTELPAELRPAAEAKRPQQKENPALTRARANVAAFDATQPARPTINLPAVNLDFPPPPPIGEENGAEVTISGQVFVTTKGAGSFKLSGVRISIYSEKSFNDQLRWIDETAGKASATYGARSDIHSKAEKYTDALSELEKARAIVHAGWQNMSRAEFSTTADADGRYSIKHRIKPPYFVVASAKRSVGADVEYYKWAVHSKDIEDPSSLMLHNENMK